MSFVASKVTPGLFTMPSTNQLRPGRPMVSPSRLARAPRWLPAMMPPAPSMFCGTMSGLPGMKRGRWRTMTREAVSTPPPGPYPMMKVMDLPR